MFLWRLIKAGVSSFFATLFLALCFVAFITLLLIPSVGMQMKPIVCADGEMRYETFRRQTVDGVSTETIYYCNVDGQEEQISFWELAQPVLIVYLAFCFGVVWPLGFVLRLVRLSRKEESATIIDHGTHHVETQTTNIVVNGKSYSSVEEMPPAVRQQYEQAMSVLQDADGDGTPDILQGNVPADIIVEHPQSASDRLQRLQRLYEQGLITQTEYQQKRAEILDEL